ncbi:hypothetical protein [Streptomyces sp. NPDC047928]|uniref:hypothetical protein n=1 Tax=unclassified Streptomyces TaxID=2593676 RepID=UPI00371513D9
MPASLELTDLDALIDDLDERISDTELPTATAHTAHCSGLCTVIVCDSVIGVC